MEGVARPADGRIAEAAATATGRRRRRAARVERSRPAGPRPRGRVVHRGRPAPADARRRARGAGDLARAAARARARDRRDAPARPAARSGCRRSRASGCAAHFEPAAGEVGGDWYDAVRLDSGELALAIGDVAGKGIPAATLMGELRGGLRAGVLDGGEPTDDAARGSTASPSAPGAWPPSLLVLLDPRTGALRHASAGHLPPLLIEPDGAVRFLARRRRAAAAGLRPRASARHRTARPRRAAAALHRRPGGAPRRSRSTPASRASPTSPPSTTGPSSPTSRRPPMAAPGGRPARRHRGPRGAARTLTRHSLSLRLPASGCGEIGIHAGFRCLWALRPWRFESSQPHSRRPLLLWAPRFPAAIV